MSSTLRGAAARIDVQAVALAGAASLLWLALAPRTPDLAAQSYRVALWRAHGFELWDNGWYAGMYVPSYSLTFPPVAALLGLRVAGALAAPVSAFCFARLAEAHFGERARAGVLWFALACAGDLAIGRLTYAWGAALGLAALLAALHGRRLWLAALLALLCAATSPLAGAMLIGVALLLGRERRAQTVALAGPAFVVLALLAVVFGQAGRQPFGVRVFVTSVAMACAFVVALPAQERRLRAGGLLYLAASVVLFLVDSPVGDNLNRAGAVFMGPLLACALLAHPRRETLLRWAGVAAVVVLGCWQVFGPVREIRKGSGDRLTRASSYSGLVAFLSAHGAPPGRLEVPFTTSHWEAAFLGSRFALARGWEKQLDAERNGVFYGGRFSATAYHAWLRSLGVRYVALARVSMDPTSRAEVALLRRGPPFLREVFSDGLWTVFAVRDPAPLASAPATVTALTAQGVRLRFSAAGESEVRVRFTPYWAVRGGCVRAAPDGFTLVSAPAAGDYALRIAFSLRRVISHGRRC